MMKLTGLPHITPNRVTQMVRDGVLAGRLRDGRWAVNGDSVADYCRRWLEVRERSRTGEPV
jgi:hypothetical protein